MFAVKNLAPGQFFNLLNSIQYTAGDILKRSFDRRWGLSAMSLPILIA